MANSTAGQLYGPGLVGAVEALRYNGGAVSGSPTNKLFDTWEWSVIDWQRNNEAAISVMGDTTIKKHEIEVPFKENYSGTYKIAGTVKSNGSPYQAWVHLFPSNAMPAMASPIASVYVGTDGAFLFDHLAAGTYLVIAVDVTGGSAADTYDVIGCDFVTAVPM